MVTDKSRQNRKNTRIFAAIAETILVIQWVSGAVQHGLSSKTPVYWTAAAIEAVLAYLAYKIQNSSRIGYALLSLMAFATPITLYYTVPSLKPAGNSFWIYVMVSLAFTIYNPPTVKSVTANRMLLVLQVLSSIFMVTILAAIIGIAIILSRPSFTPAFKSGDPSLAIVQITLGIFSVIVLVIGFFLPRIFRWNKRGERKLFEVQIVHILRSGLFESIGIYGFILAFLGGTWLAWLPMLLISALAQVLIFPTQKRFDSWLGVQNSTL